MNYLHYIGYGVIVVGIILSTIIGNAIIKHADKIESTKQIKTITKKIDSSKDEIIKELKSLILRESQEKNADISEEKLEEDGINYYEELKNKNANFLYLKGYEEIGEISFWFTPGWPNEVPLKKFYLSDFVGNLEKNRISLYVNEKRQLVYQVLTSDGRMEFLTTDISHWRKGQAYFIAFGWDAKKDIITLAINKKPVAQKIIPNLHFDILGPIAFAGIDFEGKFPANIGIGEGFPVKHEKTDDIWKAMGQPGKEYKRKEDK